MVKSALAIRKEFDIIEFNSYLSNNLFYSDLIVEL